MKRTFVAEPDGPLHPLRKVLPLKKSRQLVHSPGPNAEDNPFRPFLSQYWKYWFGQGDEESTQSRSETEKGNKTPDNTVPQPSASSSRPSAPLQSILEIRTRRERESFSIQDRVPLPFQNIFSRSYPKQTGPHFTAQNETKAVIEVVNTVFTLMEQKIEKDTSDRGRIYILRRIQEPRFLKIGRTTKDIKDRQKAIEPCVGKTEVIYGKDLVQVSNHTRLERLIHTELWRRERKFQCFNCSQKHQSHREWFEGISDEEAIEVVNRWRNWMLSEPYRSGKLRFLWQLRIRAYTENDVAMRSLVLKDKGDWRWCDFMEASSFGLADLWLRFFLFARRHVERSSCSRWDSLLQHWKSNVIFGFIISLISVVSSGISSFFQFSLPAYMLMNIAILGVGGALYAA